jgi:hypothetical protein
MANHVLHLSLVTDFRPMKNDTGADMPGIVNEGVQPLYFLHEPIDQTSGITFKEFCA